MTEVFDEDSIDPLKIADHKPRSQEIVEAAVSFPASMRVGMV